MISTEIEKVSNTKILVGPNYNNTRQLVVYSNYINNLTNYNAMVLPVPYPESVKFIDLSRYKDIFKDCALCFYNPNATYGKGFVSKNSTNFRDSDELEVFNVGSYKVSLAKNLDEISKINNQVFFLSPGLKKTLEMFYYQPYWGFIICKLNVGSDEYHPFAYSHKIIDNKIYIPTRHYHQEGKWSKINSWALGFPVDPKENPLNFNSWNETNIDKSPMFRTEQFGSNIYYDLFENIPNYGRGNNLKDTQNNVIFDKSRINNLRKMNDPNYYNNEKTNIYQNRQTNTTEELNFEYKNIADDWSHNIYLFNLNPNLNENIKKMNTSNEIWDKQTIFDPEKIDFDFGRCTNFTKLEINGSNPNIDLVIPVY